MWNSPLQGVVAQVAGQVARPAQVVVAGVRVHQVAVHQADRRVLVLVVRAPVVLHNINQKEVVLSRLEFKEIISSSSVMWFDPDKTWIEV